MRFATFALTTLLASASVAAQQTTADTPYSLRGVKLGSTIDEFKAFPIPAAATDFEPAPRCGIDETLRWDRDLDREGQAVGVIRCRWTSLSALGRFIMNVDVANTRPAPDFDFVPTPDGQLRLFRISANLSITQWNDVVPSFEQAYGKPQLSTRNVQNRAGGSFESRTVTWANNVSRIQIVERCGSMEDLCIIITHDALDAEYKKRVAARAAEGAAKL